MRKTVIFDFEIYTATEIESAGWVQVPITFEGDGTGVYEEAVKIARSHYNNDKSLLFRVSKVIRL